jgi:hypothetical protein
MITYNKFKEDISILQSKGWKPNKGKIDTIEKTIGYLENEISKGNINPETIMETLKIPMNVGIAYCGLILQTVKGLQKKYEESNTFDQQEINNVHYCIGDLTSKVNPSNEDLHMLFVFSPNQSIRHIVKSLILLSKLPFDNDDTRIAFNQIVQRYQKLGDNPPNLKPVALEKPGGCYIATMVYGGDDHPQVMFLRNYRDNTLLKSVFGRLFVKFYYLIAPSLVSLLKKQRKINYLIKIILEKLIEKLKRSK